MPSLKKQAWLLLAASIILQLVILRSTRALKDDSIAPPSTLTRRMLKRGVEESQVSPFQQRELRHRKLSLTCRMTTGTPLRPLLGSPLSYWVY